MDEDDELMRNGVNIILKKTKIEIYVYFGSAQLGLDAPHSFSTSEVPPKGPSVTDATFSPGPGNQNGHLASKRPRKSAIFS